MGRTVTGRQERQEESTSEGRVQDPCRPCYRLRVLELLELTARSHDIPLTVTRMVWCTEARRLRAVQRYSPASDSDTSTIRSVFWKCRKEVRLAGNSPLTLLHETSGVGLEGGGEGGWVGGGGERER